MVPDVSFEADVLRTALLLGLVREQEIIAWADALLLAGVGPHDALAEVALARPELTAVREALHPLTDPPDPERLPTALLAFLAADPGVAHLGARDRIAILGQLRREHRLSPSLEAAVKQLELASTDTALSKQSLDDEVTAWLRTVRSPSYYRVSRDCPTEYVPHLNAQTGTFVMQGWGDAMRAGAGQAWVVEVPQGAPTTLLLDEVRWQIVVDRAALPVGSRIPYRQLPANVRRVPEGHHS